MKTMLIKSSILAFLAAALPAHFGTASTTNSYEADEDCNYYTACYDDGEESECSTTYTSTCTIDDNDNLTVTFIDSNGEEHTFDYPCNGDINELISTVDGDITIKIEADENGNNCVYVCSEYVIDDDNEDIESTTSYTFYESDDTEFTTAE